MVLAFAVQPLVTALLAFVTFPIIEYTGRSLYGGRPIDPVDAAVAVAAGAAIVGLLVTTFMGIASAAVFWSVAGLSSDD